MTTPDAVLLRLMSNRRSVRTYAPGPLSERHLAVLFEAFTQAPSAGGKKDARCHFLTQADDIAQTAKIAEASFEHFLESLDSPAIQEELRNYAGNFFWFTNAPALAVVTCRVVPAFLAESLGPDAPVFFGSEASAYMAVQNLLLAAESLHLAACCLTGPLAARKGLHDYLKISPNRQIVCLVALGRKKDPHHDRT